jgi:hypothetical protein
LLATPAKAAGAMTELKENKKDRITGLFYSQIET